MLKTWRGQGCAVHCADQLQRDAIPGEERFRSPRFIDIARQDQQRAVLAKFYRFFIVRIDLIHVLDARVKVNLTRLGIDDCELATLRAAAPSRNGVVACEIRRACRLPPQLRAIQFCHAC